MVHSRHFDAFSHRARYRPAPAGVSIGHCKVTAGTLGGWTRGAPGTARYNRLLLLSNNHVIANSNSAPYGDAIIQPGTYDGDKCNAADRIAILERFVPITFTGACNYVDAATGWCWPNLVRRDFIYRAAAGYAYFRVGNTPVVGGRNLWVGKTGRTTRLTRGYVTDVNWSGRVNYGGGRVAMFCGQIVIRAASGDFSAGGDSSGTSARGPHSLPGARECRRSGHRTDRSRVERSAGRRRLSGIPRPAHRRRYRSAVHLRSRRGAERRPASRARPGTGASHQTRRGAAGTSRTPLDWMPLGNTDEGKPVQPDTVEAWARDATNPVGGYYALRKGYRRKRTGSSTRLSTPSIPST